MTALRPISYSRSYFVAFPRGLLRRVLLLVARNLAPDRGVEVDADLVGEPQEVDLDVGDLLRDPLVERVAGPDRARLRLVEPLEDLQQFRRLHRERGGEVLRGVELLPVAGIGEALERALQPFDVEFAHRLTPSAHSPVNLGSRFSKNARAPSRLSRVIAVCTSASVSKWSAPSREPSSAESIIALWSWTATGARLAMRSARTVAASRSVPSGTTRLTSPMRCASAASNQLAGVGQLARLREPDLARHEVRAAVGDRDPDVHLRKAEPRRLRRHHEVAGEHHLAPGPDRVAVHARDDRAPRLADAAGAVLEVLLPLAELGRGELAGLDVLVVLADLPDVVPREERAAFAREHEAAHVAVPRRRRRGARRTRPSARWSWR